MGCNKSKLQEDYSNKKYMKRNGHSFRCRVRDGCGESEDSTPLVKKCYEGWSKEMGHGDSRLNVENVDKSNIIAITDSTTEDVVVDIENSAEVENEVKVLSSSQAKLVPEAILGLANVSTECHPPTNEDGDGSDPSLSRTATVKSAFESFWLPFEEQPADSSDEILLQGPALEKRMISQQNVSNWLKTLPDNNNVDESSSEEENEEFGFGMDICKSEVRLEDVDERPEAIDCDKVMKAAHPLTCDGSLYSGDWNQTEDDNEECPGIDYQEELKLKTSCAIGEHVNVDQVTSWDSTPPPPVAVRQCGSRIASFFVIAPPAAAASTSISACGSQKPPPPPVPRKPLRKTFKTRSRPSSSSIKVPYVPIMNRHCLDLSKGDHALVGTDFGISRSKSCTKVSVADATAEGSSTEPDETLGELVRIFSPKPFKTPSGTRLIPVMTKVLGPVLKHDNDDMNRPGIIEEEFVELFKSPRFHYDSSDSSTAPIPGQNFDKKELQCENSQINTSTAGEPEDAD